MTNLRLLTVLMVLAAVCWEANSWKGYMRPKVCSSEPKSLSCEKEGQVFRVAVMTYQTIKGRYYYKPYNSCVKNLRKTFERECEDKHSCHVDVDEMAAVSKGCKKQEFCLLLTLQCM